MKFFNVVYVAYVVTLLSLEEQVGSSLERPSISSINTSSFNNSNNILGSLRHNKEGVIFLHYKMPGGKWFLVLVQRL